MQQYQVPNYKKIVKKFEKHLEILPINFKFQILENDIIMILKVAQA
jgi:hypothetical protein